MVPLGNRPARKYTPLFRFLRITAISLVVLVFISWTPESHCAEQVPSGIEGFNSTVVPFFASYCRQCHGEKTPKSELSLSNISIEFSAKGIPEKWEQIAEMLEAGEMPPADEKQPTEAERVAISKWIVNQLAEAAANTKRSIRDTSARRLTNVEYQNTLRDLLGFELHLAKYLPEDPGKPYHFNNTSEYLLLGTERFERYEAVANLAMKSAIVDPIRPDIQKARKEWQKQSETNPKNELGITGNRRGTPFEGVKFTKWPATGEYRVRVKASAVFPEGTTEMPLRLVMGYGLAGDIGSAPFVPVGTIRLRKEQAESEVYEFRGRIENHPWEPERKERSGGKRTGNLRTHPANMVVSPQNLFDDGTLNDGVDPLTKPRAIIDWIEFESPIENDLWPPEHHKRILFESPLRTSDPEQYVRMVLLRFMTRAFRRPTTEKEVERFAKIYEIYTKGDSSMESAMRFTLASVLTSPNFLYHTQSGMASFKQYEIANRLSYFLWASMPDQQLFELAKNGRLNDGEIIAQQVDRMLHHPKAEDFIRNFTNQWLALERCKSIPINGNRFPRFLYTQKRGERAGREVPFLPTIRDDMVDETVAFISHLIHENRRVTDIVDSDFAMLNQRLAYHYGVDGVRGHELRPVQIGPEHHLGGLLTHGSVLIGTGTGSAPHPIYRAVWLREAILGDHVKDPPADVPALEDSAGKSAETASTIKDLLKLHRTKTSCNDCHARLDPWGIPFEHYNAIGKYQPAVTKDGVRVRGYDKKVFDNYAGYEKYLASIYTEPVDAASQLPDGSRVNGMGELKRYLLEQRKDEIVRNVVRRLLSYSLGRVLTFRDRPAVDKLLEQTSRNDHRFKEIITEICRSELFLSGNSK